MVGTTTIPAEERTGNGRTLLRQGSRAVEDRRGRGVPRRRHPRGHQGASPVGRRLCRRLPGRADFAPHGRPRRRRGYPRRARRSFRSERQRGHRRCDARRERPLSDPRRGHLEGHCRHQRRLRRPRQPRLGRGQGRRADRRRRGLRRRLLDHAGAEPCLRDEVADLAARSAAQPRDHRQAGRGGVRAVGGLEHAGDARDPHPHLPPPRPLRRQGQQASGIHRQGRAGEAGARDQPHRAAARLLSPRAGEDQCPPAGGDQIHQGAEAQRGLRCARTECRNHPPGRHV